MAKMPSKLSASGGGPSVASPMAAPYSAQKSPKAVGATPNLMKHAKPMGNFDAAPQMNTPNLARLPHKRNG